MPVQKICAIFIGCNYESRTSHTEDPRRQNHFQLGLYAYLNKFRSLWWPSKEEIKDGGRL